MAGWFEVLWFLSFDSFKIDFSIVEYRPHSPSELHSFPSLLSGTPKGKEQCCIAYPNFITTTSASPSFSLSKGEGAVLNIFNELHHYHIIFISLLNTFGDTDCYQHFRQAWAVHQQVPLRGF